MTLIKKTFLTVLLFISCSILAQSNLKEKYNLMPWPQEIKENQEKFKITPDFTISVEGKSKRVINATTNFLRRLSGRTGVFIDEGFAFEKGQIKSPSLEIKFDKEIKLGLNKDESYSLDITNQKISITAKTDVGALRALETLLQLVDYNTESFYFSGVLIKDNPRFVWRGLMIDVARHFQPIAVIKRNLDAMASVKMNVFHWHLTDDQGFRIYSKTYPNLHKLGSDGLYYTHAQIKDVIEYANLRGIRVIPEIDVPGHASAFLTAYPEIGSKETSYQIERYAGIFDPTLDPTNDKTYEFLDNLFKEITPLFPDEYFHIGGDENEGKHWDANQKIQEFKKQHNLKTNHDLQTYFNIKLEKILKKYNKKLMGWDEIMTPNMPTTTVIHSWRGENEGLSKGGTLIEAARKGYNTVLSNGFYIDRMQPVEEHYLVEPIGDEKLSKEERKRILGGEATMWSELVTPLTIDSRIWPRTAAIAERFWSSKNVRDVNNMQKRLKVVSYQLEELGITHLKNKDAILRNITRNQNTNALKILSNISEPLKIYTRNKGGTEYKSFSPFTLFADACTSDAEDGISFKKVVDRYIKDQNSKSKEELILYFNKWKEGFKEFKKLDMSPVLTQIEPSYSYLAEFSKIISLVLEDGYSKSKEASLNKIVKKLQEPFVDVELIIVSDLDRLLEFFRKK